MVDGLVYSNIRRYEYTKDNKLEAVYSGNTLLVAYTYDGDGTITSTLDRDLDFNQNLNINDHGYINRLTNNQKQLINKINPSDTILYELTEYVLDRNRPYVETLMQRDGAGFLSTTYTYGNQRINTESINNLSGIYTYDGRGSVSSVIGGWGDFRVTYWYDGLGNVKSQIHGYGAFGSGKRYFGYNAEQYNPVTGNQNLRNRQVNIRRQRFLSEDTYLGNKTITLSLNRYIYAFDNPLVNKDPDGFVPVYIQNQGTNNNGKEPYIIEQRDEQYFIRNGAEPVYSKNGDNYYITSGNIEVKEMPQPIISGITSISSPGYQDDSPYVVDNVYSLPTINVTNSNIKYVQKEIPIGNATVIFGTGLGGNIKIFGEDTGWQIRYAAERELFCDKQIRGVLNLEQVILGSGYSFNRDYINNKVDNYGLLLHFLNNEKGDLVFNFGFEAYMGIGGGVSLSVNISELCRRVQKMLPRGCHE